MQLTFLLSENERAHGSGKHRPAGKTKPRLQLARGYPSTCNPPPPAHLRALPFANQQQHPRIPFPRPGNFSSSTLQTSKQRQAEKGRRFVRGETMTQKEIRGRLIPRPQSKAAGERKYLLNPARCPPPKTAGPGRKGLERCSAPHRLHQRCCLWNIRSAIRVGLDATAMGASEKRRLQHSPAYVTGPVRSPCSGE